jgi:uncharacterized protein GlcG (DUF336 family)
LLKTVSGRGYRLLGNWTIRQDRTPTKLDVPERVRAAPDSFQTNVPVAASAHVGRETAVQHLCDLVSETKAAEIGQPMNIAVADAGGYLVAHVRMDGARLGTIDISINKAFTASAFDIETAALAKLSQPGEDFFGIHASNQGRVMVFAGGIPLRRDGRVVGSIGVSGGSGAQDQAVAEAGAASFRQAASDGTRA